MFQKKENDLLFIFQSNYNIYKDVSEKFNHYIHMEKKKQKNKIYSFIKTITFWLGCSTLKIFFFFFKHDK